MTAHKGYETLFHRHEKNPILTQRDLDGNAPQAVTATGHANLVEGPDGNWWAVTAGPCPACSRSASGNSRWPMPRINEPKPPSSNASP